VPETATRKEEKKAVEKRKGREDDAKGKRRR
jgi:hypothetical protein